MKQKLMAVMTAGTLLFGTMTTGAFADTTISGNGSHSDNTITQRVSNRATLDQSNTSNFHNRVNVSANTGGNRANDNTGGDSRIDTGSTWASVDISNTAGKNSASLGGLCSCRTSGSGDLRISGNGSFSDNRISSTENNSLRVDQSNHTTIDNNVSVHGNTGGNSSSFNTGGDSSITTGDAGAHVSIDNTAGSNWLSL